MVGYRTSTYRTTESSYEEVYGTYRTVVYHLLFLLVVRIGSPMAMLWVLVALPFSVADPNGKPDRCKLHALGPGRRAALAAISARVVLSAAEALEHGPAPPLRDIIGAREEASLVDEAPPGTIRLFIRAVELLLVFLPLLLGAPLALHWPFFRDHVFFVGIKRGLARAGTAFIKWGQWASCR